MGIPNQAEEAVSSLPMGWAARVGLLARAVVYLILGWLAITVAFGDRAAVDQKGVLTEVLERPLGPVLVAALALGFAAYALWRLSEVVVGPTGEPDGALPRLASLVRAVAYAALSVVAVSVLLGAGGSQERQQEQLAAGLLPTTWGRVLVGLAGLALVGVGAYQVWQALTTRFLRQFPGLTRERRQAVTWLGRIGITARGVVFAATGVMLVIAAVRVDPDQAGGMDDAMTAVRTLPGGGAITLALGAGLVLFGVYALAEAAWRRVPDDEPRGASRAARRHG